MISLSSNGFASFMILPILMLCAPFNSLPVIVISLDIKLFVGVTLRYKREMLSVETPSAISRVMFSKVIPAMFITLFMPSVLPLAKITFWFSFVIMNFEFLMVTLLGPPLAGDSTLKKQFKFSALSVPPCMVQDTLMSCGLVKLKITLLNY